jgi:hypothetical protein
VRSAISAVSSRLRGGRVDEGDMLRVEKEESEVVGEGGREAGKLKERLKEVDDDAGEGVRLCGFCCREVD